VAKRKTNRTTPAAAAKKPSRRSGPKMKASNGAPRLLPKRDELKSLYERYTKGSQFDEHDKAFYFVLDVGGISRAKQLLAHVEEVLCELEEVRG
jgi:hypothetical protein